MKVFFSAANDVSEEIYKQYLEIILFLEKLGFTISSSFTKKKDFQYTHMADIHKAVYEDILMRIDQADIFIADISSPSGGVGYQIYHAIYQKKPVIIIYTLKDQANPSFLIRGIASKQVSIIEYQSLEHLKKELIKKINRAKSLLRVRFNLVISNLDYSFIENESKKINVSKTEYIKKLIKLAQRGNINMDRK